MPALINGNLMREQEYENEDELQKLLFKYPFLLQNENDANYYSIKREVNLPSAGRLDLLLINDKGNPIAVEVKLDRNSQSRREVVAQVIDYISDIKYLNYYSLDELTDGKLEEMVYRIDTEKKLPKIINGLISSGYVKMIIAVDHANVDLRRNILFLKERYNIDVRLVEISKYNNGEILIPKIIVETKESISTEKQNVIIKTSSKNDRNEIFENIMSYYNNNTIQELKARNNTPGYRLFRFNNWPSMIHYEFVDRKRSKSIGIEFHIEKKGLEVLKKEIEKFNGKKVYDKEIEFDPTWSGQKGRIKITCLYSIGEAAILKYMLELIRITKEDINKYFS